ncbi:MAG: DinB family protein [Ktedonobacteraceae bacterium]
MNINLEAVRTGQISYADIVRNIRHTDLYTMTDELFDELEAILVKATDAAVLFVPRDSAATDQSEQGWTLSHIVAHLTATLEETAAVAAMFARGVKVEARLRYETPWENLSTLQMVLARLRESHRICRAFLNAWPDEPHFDVTATRIPLFGPMDAVGMYVLGLAHGQGHLDQLRETVQQFTLFETC